MFFINLYEILNSVDNTLERNIKSYDNSFVDNFIDELKDYLLDRRDINRLKQMSENTMYEIDGEGDDYFVTVVDTATPELPKLNGIPHDVFYIPKNICSPNIDESLYKTEDIVQEEISYKNYLQLKDGVYTVVDKNGNVLT